MLDQQLLSALLFSISGPSEEGGERGRLELSFMTLEETYHL